MAYASVTYTSASGTTFALTNSSGDPIPYLRQSDISVTVNGVLKTLTTDYTFNTAGTSIVLNTSVSGASVVIARVTDIADATVTYTAGSTLTAQDLNNADNQIRYGLQEFSDTYGALTTGTGDLSALAGFIGSSETWTSDNAHTATTGAIDNRVDSKITTNNATVVLRDGSQAMQAALSLGGFKITNLATPISNTDASTKAYVDSNVGSVSASATAAAASASAAATSASNASTSASAASASQSAAASSASSASTSASNASTSASSASTSASNASTNATNAATSATSAASSAASALAAFDSFDDRYLGSKASDPTVDNDGDPLNAGDIYFNTTLSIMRVYTGTVWVAAYVPGDAVNISFTPYSTVAATNVQNAVQELTDEKLNLTGGTLTGALVSPLGSAAAPSLTFTGDTNTGIYSPGADQVAISTAGSGRLFIDASGNVGVGISSVPFYSANLLTVAFNNTNGVVHDYAVSGVKTGFLNCRSTGFEIGTQTSSPLLFTTNSSEKVRITSAGLVGIGTSAPATALQVNGDIRAVGAAGTGYELNDANTKISIPAANSIAFSTSGVERVRINNIGQVGIGVTAPEQLLHIGGNNGIRFGNAAATPKADISYTSSGDEFLDIKIQGTTTGYGNIRFSTGPTPSERARIDSSGRLLVGTSSATGSTVTNQVHIESSSDYTSLKVSSNSTTADQSPFVVFSRSRGTSNGAVTIVTNNDSLGGLLFAGANGSNLNSNAASIRAYVDGTPGAADMPGRLVFSTTSDGADNPTERMRISNDGTVFIGQTANPATATLVLKVPTGSGNGVNAQITSNTGTSFPWSNYNASNTYVGGISCTSTATSFPTSSDYRLKTNVQPLADAISLVSQLKPSTFEFNENLGETVQGFIAHELQEVVPLAVIGEKDAEDANGNPIYQGVDAAKLVPLLTAALQEAVAEIKSLKARVAALESV